MRDFVLNALRRNREIAKKAGWSERVERYDARLARLEGRGRSAKKEKEPAVEVEPEEEAAEVDIEDYAQGGGWYLIRGEKVQGRAAALALLNGEDEA